MKKLDRDYAKSKKRADQLQKDQDKSKSELTKTVTMKDKLEKLCRELTKENKKVKVSWIGIGLDHCNGIKANVVHRMTIRNWMTRSRRRE